jgi:hypothetical protein
VSRLRRVRSVAPPPGADADERVVDGLRASGAVLGRPRVVQHYLVSASRNAGSTATLQLREAGFDASLIESPTTAGWIVVAERTEEFDHDSVRMSRELLELIAERAEHTRYDGWHTHLLDDERGRGRHDR